MTWPQDRAAIVTRAIGRILADIENPTERDRQIEALLRDEFENIKQEAASERKLTD
jgi:hypothetical protein